jgi:hypothetical protein
MGCTFCYTGRMGFLKNLSTAQIVEQLIVARRILATSEEAAPATNIVFMGMGVPPSRSKQTERVRGGARCERGISLFALISLQQCLFWAIRCHVYRHLSVGHCSASLGLVVSANDLTRRLCNTTLVPLPTCPEMTRICW